MVAQKILKLNRLSAGERSGGVAVNEIEKDFDAIRERMRFFFRDAFGFQPIEEAVAADFFGLKIEVFPLRVCFAVGEFAI